MNCYPLDTLIQLKVQFTADDGVTPFEPAVVALEVRSPDGVLTAYPVADLTHVSYGLWTYDLFVAQSGPWIYSWYGDGNTSVDTGDIYFSVELSAAIAG